MSLHIEYKNIKIFQILIKKIKRSKKYEQITAKLIIFSL